MVDMGVVEIGCHPSVPSDPIRLHRGRVGAGLEAGMADHTDMDTLHHTDHHRVELSPGKGVRPEGGEQA